MQLSGEKWLLEALEISKVGERITSITDPLLKLNSLTQ